MKSAAPLILVTIAVLGRAGCGGPSTPTPSASPSPSASPTFPRGVPNATALENLPLVESLERAQGRRTTRLVWVSTEVKLDGRLPPGSAWIYQFGEIVENRGNVFQWDVTTDGAIEYPGSVTDYRRVDFSELRPLAIDSPEMVRLGLRYGAQEFVDRYPNAVVSMIYRYLGGEPIVVMAFAAQPTVNCAALIYVHAHSGELMARDLGSCLNR